MANQAKDVTEKDVEKMLRRKSVLDVEVPTKSLLDWKLDRKYAVDQVYKRNFIISACNLCLITNVKPTRHYY